jgi:hypothetical protein
VGGLTFTNLHVFSPDENRCRAVNRGRTWKKSASPIADDGAAYPEDDRRLKELKEKNTPKEDSCELGCDSL